MAIFRMRLFQSWRGFDFQIHGNYLQTHLGLVSRLFDSVKYRFLRHLLLLFCEFKVENAQTNQPWHELTPAACGKVGNL
jgi:hypothetical protein